MYALALLAVAFCAPGPPIPAQSATSTEALSGEGHPLGEEEGWWGAVKVNLSEEEYRFSSVPGAPRDASGVPEVWTAPNRVNGFRVTVEPRSLRFGPRTESASPWQVEVSNPLLGFALPAAEGSTVTRHFSGVVERVTNVRRGLAVAFELERWPPDPLIDLSLRAASARLSPDRQSVDFIATSGALVLRFSDLKVHDARGQAFPAAMALAGTALRLELDAGDAFYPLTVEFLATSAAWIADGSQAGEIFGYSLDTAGDVNGDGYSDVIVGAYGYSNGEDSEGRAYLYLGSAAGLGATPVWTAEGNQTGVHFGRSVGPAGDVNGDGYGDVIVGAVYYDNGQTDEGRAYVYYGSPTGLLPTPTTVESDQADARMGICVATAGDVNGDGFADVIVGAYTYDNGQSNEGRAFVYYGSAQGLVTTPAWTGESDQADAIFGIRVASAGDVNADGYSDVLVSAYFYDGPAGANAGRAYVFHGSPAGLSPTPAWIGAGDQAFGEFSDRIAAGDFNGDGYSDIAVGSHEYDKGQTDEGIVTLFRGAAAGVETTPVWIGEVDQAFASYAGSLAFSDVNGDGYADLLITAQLFDVEEENEGRAYVHLGSAAGITPAPSWIAEGNQGGANFGTAIASAGDVNGDGFLDVLVGAPGYNGAGRAYLFLGSAAGLPSRDAWHAQPNQVGAEMGYALRGAGDVNGDGYADVVVGAPRFDNGEVDEGRAFVFQGSASGLSTVPAWSAESNQAGALFGSAVSGALDVDGDGYADVLIGAPRYDASAGADEGRALLYRGSATGLASTATWTTNGGQAGARYGQSVAWAGDVNGDGYSDVAVGAPQFNGGRAFVFHGASSGLGATAAWSAEGSQAAAEFGSALSTAGDINGDGYSDVVIGAPLHDGSAPDGGRAVLFYGSLSGLAPSPAWSIEGNQPGAALGSAVATAGDMDGDGYSDVAIGVPKLDTLLADAGRVLVYRGSVTGLTVTPTWSVDGDQVNSGFGSAIAGAGDVNADGFSDLVVGAPDYDVTATGEGRALLYYGSATGPSTNPAWAVAGGQAGAAFGFSVAPAGDVDGDGIADLLVGARLHEQGQADEGGAYMFPGNNGGVDRLPRQARADGTAPIDLLGRADLAGEFQLKTLGRSAAGRARVRIEWEVEPLGTPFGVAGIVRGSWTDSGPAGALGSATELVAPVEGLALGPYHWRSRVAAASPFFPRSPWFSPVANAPGETDLRVPCPATTLAEVAGLRGLADKETYDWLPVGGSVVYDVPRGLTSQLPVGSGGAETCVGSGIPTPSVSDDDVPAPGAAYWYLVRARSACAIGGYGATSSGTPRSTAICP
jgi:hypothetical protein